MIGRLAKLLGAAALTAFGLAALHYTTWPKAEHHREWALEAGMPEPSFSIFLLGAAATVLGAALLGFVVGRRAPRG